MIPNLRLLYLIRDFKPARKAKIWKPTKYEAIPHYYKPHFIDIHDTYTLRTKQQVKEQLKDQNFTLDVQFLVVQEKAADAKIMARKAITTFNIEQFKFTDLQLKRFKVLMGPRFKQGQKTIKLTCQTHPTYEQNIQRLFEIFHDIILESKRAP